MGSQGSTIFGDGDGLKELRGLRLAMATNELSKLKFLWNGQDPQARLRIRRTCVFPLATYRHLEKQQRINAFEMKCYRKILKILWVNKQQTRMLLKRH